jgi:hypothetical protein
MFHFFKMSYEGILKKKIAQVPLILKITIFQINIHILKLVIVVNNQDKYLIFVLFHVTFQENFHVNLINSFDTVYFPHYIAITSSATTLKASHISKLLAMIWLWRKFF